MKRPSQILPILGVIFAVLTQGVLHTHAYPSKQLTEELRRALKEDGASWIHNVRLGSEKGRLMGACQSVKIFQRKVWVRKQVQEHHISWASLETTEKDLLAAITKTGITGAIQLLESLKLPPPIRAGVNCSEAIPDFGDGIAVLEAVLSILREGGLNPADVGTTESALRNMAVAEFRRQLEASRNAMGEEEIFFSTACKAAMEWNFSADNLALTPQEKDRFRDLKITCGN